MDNKPKGMSIYTIEEDGRYTNVMEEKESDIEEGEHQGVFYKIQYWGATIIATILAITIITLAIGYLLL